MDENLKSTINIWLEEMYGKEIKEHLKTAHTEHIWALGSQTTEESCMHEYNADMHRAYVRVLNNLLAEVQARE